jgi:hypothetical protein
MSINSVITNTLGELEGVLLQMSNDTYSLPSALLSGASIGKHVRHTIELFQCLFHGYDTGVVNYDMRKRDPMLESDLHATVTAMRHIASAIDRPNRELVLETRFGLQDAMLMPSNYTRELVYNLEHTIHHMALIKVAIQELTGILVSDGFGVAPSTLEYRAECAQ